VAVGGLVVVVVVDVLLVEAVAADLPEVSPQLTREEACRESEADVESPARENAPS
jgi:hypothetical protein